MTRNRVALGFSLFGLLLALTACGCGSNGGTTITPPPTITSVAATCAPTQVQASQTSQCSAAVQGTGNFSTAVTWSLSGQGTLSSAGLYTPPASVSSQMQAMVTATSVQDSTKSGTATVTVNPVPVPPTVSISATSPITIGQSSTIAWSSMNAASCMASGDWSGPKAVSGSETQTPTTTGTKTYSLACTGPGGSASNSATITVNPAPTLPTVSISAVPSTITLGQSSTLTWSSTNATSCVASGDWSGSEPTSGSQSVTPATTGTKTFTLSCTGPGGTTNKSATVAVDPVPNPVPTEASLSPVSATAGGAAFTLTVNGTNFISSSVVNWNGLGLPTAFVGATQLTASVSAEQIANAGNFPVTVFNPLPGGGTSNAVNFTVNPAPLLPMIISVTPNVFLPREGSANIAITGTNFIVGGTVNVSISSGTPTVIPINTITTNSQGQQVVSVLLVLDTPHYNPGSFNVTVMTPAGTSNVASLNFLGNQNTLACGKTECCQLDQAAGMINVFDLSGNKLANRSWFVGALVYGIAVDDVTNIIVTTHSNGAIGTWNADGTGAPISGFTNTQLPMAVSAHGGYAVFTRDQSNDIAYFPLNQGLVTTLPIVPIGTTPMNVTMGMVNNKLTAAVLNDGDATLAWTSIPTAGSPNFAVLPGFTKLPSVPTSNIPLAGSQLTMFSSGIVAALSRIDRKVWFVNPATGAVTGPFTVPDDPFRIQADNADNTLEVGLADPTGLSGATRFVRVDVATGAVSQPLLSVSSLLTVGFSLSPNGGQVMGCMRDACDVKPNQ